MTTEKCDFATRHMKKINEIELEKKECFDTIQKEENIRAREDIDIRRQCIYDDINITNIKLAEVSTMTIQRGIQDNFTQKAMEGADQIDKECFETMQKEENIKAREEIDRECKIDEMVEDSLGRGAIEPILIMSDEDVDNIADFLEENISEDVKHLREINREDSSYPYNTMDKPGLLEGEALVSINPMTGEHIVVGPATNSVAPVSVTDINDGVYENEMDEVMITPETYSKLGEMGISDEDAEALTSVILRYKKGEKFSIYKNLPESVKKMVKAMCGSTNITQLQSCAKVIIEQFISELHVEQEFINFQESIKKELDIPGVIDMYDDYLKDTMEVNLLKKAEEIEELHPEKAMTLREVSAAYTDSYTMRRMIECIENNGVECRRLDKEIKRYDRYCSEFNFKYKNSRFKINDITLVGVTLSRVFPEISETNLLKFIVLFCRLTRNMNSNNPVEHSFMYYSIKNLLSLDFISNESDFYKEIIGNITKVIGLIEEKDGGIK